MDFYLADYRFSDNSKDYIVKDWTFVDLSSLGAVTKLQFALSSSDTGQFGMNTPAYMAMDSMSISAVPEPEQTAQILPEAHADVNTLALRSRRLNRSLGTGFPGPSANGEEKEQNACIAYTWRDHIGKVMRGGIT